MAQTNLKLLICLVFLGETTLAEAGCLRTVSEIKANGVKARWQETTENFSDAVLDGCRPA
jgi:hypothetical protein